MSQEYVLTKILREGKEREDQYHRKKYHPHIISP